MEARDTPSLRIARLVITNFRTFRGPTEILLSSGGEADIMTVFHGTNGAGKSNALAAIDLAFRVASCWLSSGATGVHQPAFELKLPWGWRDERSGLSLNHRTWPSGSRDPQVIELHFEDTRLRPLRATLTPSGNDAVISLEQWLDQNTSYSAEEGYRSPAREDISALKNALETPRGPGSKPFFLLDARRRDFRSIGEGAREGGAPETPLSPVMADRLLALATSLEPDETERWRAFIALIGRFKMLSGRELSVLRVPVGNREVIDLRFEVRGKQILRLSELSSGEQQVVALVAAMLTSRAALVAIEEPEMSLHPENQELVREVLLEQVRSGVVDQIFLESHVPIFDGPEVLRFSRLPGGDTSVIRQPARSDSEIRTRALARGAEEQWVTSEGYTRLPATMREQLDLKSGGHLWFLQSRPEGRWEAWTAAELNEQLGLGDRSSEDA